MNITLLKYLLLLTIICLINPTAPYSTPPLLAQQLVITPTPQPTPSSAPPVVARTISHITYEADGRPTYQRLFTTNPEALTTLHIGSTQASLQLNRSTSSATSPLLATRQPTTTSTFIDTWQPLLQTSFETTFPPPACVVQDFNDDGQEHLWGDTDSRHHLGDWAIWPLSGGADALTAGVDNFLPYTDSRLICGPYNFPTLNTEKVWLDFSWWADVPEADDDLSVGIVTSPEDEPAGAYWSGVTNGWQQEHIWFEWAAGLETAYLVFQFKADGDSETGLGVWLDDIDFSIYTPPPRKCGADNVPVCAKV